MKKSLALHLLNTYNLPEKCPNTEFFLVLFFPYSDRVRENTDQKKLCIWTLFTQWYNLRLSSKNWSQVHGNILQSHRFCRFLRQIKHCVKVSKNGVFSGLYFLVFGLNTEIYCVNFRIQYKYGKIRTRKNSVIWLLLTLNDGKFIFISFK